MSKARSAVKFGTAGAVTALYTVAAIRTLKGKQPPSPATARQVAIVAAALTAATWVSALS